MERAIHTSYVTEAYLTLNAFTNRICLLTFCWNASSALLVFIKSHCLLTFCWNASSALLVVIAILSFHGLINQQIVSPSPAQFDLQEA